MSAPLPAVYSTARPFPPYVSTAAHPLEIFDITFLHFHDSVELGLCAQGAGVCIVDGVEYPFAAGDVELIFPWQRHLSKSLRGQTSCWRWLTLDLSALMAAIGVTDLRPVEALIRTRMGRCGIFAAQRDPEVHAMIAAMFADASSAAQDADAVSRCAVRFYELLLLLARQSNALPRLDIRVNRKLHAVNAALGHIQRALADGTGVGVAELAADCRMSEPNFRRVFRAAVGLPPHAYIQRCRLYQAERLLLESECSVLQISEQCGFSDVSGFNRLFLQSRGMTPSAYRRTYASGAIQNQP